ncbi:MAG: BrnA antitoxin family protein [Brucella anthropi]
MARKWPAFVTKDLGNTPEDDAEMQRRWEQYDREMRALIATGTVYQDDEGWWYDKATGELIGPDPEIERASTPEELAQAKPFAEVFPEAAAEIKRTRGPGKKPAKEIVTLRLDPDVVEAFKADGPGWQGRVNAALRKAKKLPDRAA